MTSDKGAYYHVKSINEFAPACFGYNTIDMKIEETDELMQKKRHDVNEKKYIH